MQGSVHSIQAAGQLPDPMLRAGIDNFPVTSSDRFSGTREVHDNEAHRCQPGVALRR